MDARISMRRAHSICDPCAFSVDEKISKTSANGRLRYGCEIWCERKYMRARGYLCCSTGNVTDEIVAEYIANQTENRDDDFKVEG